jgi:hypothetical protein
MSEMFGIIKKLWQDSNIINGWNIIWFNGENYKILITDAWAGEMQELREMLNINAKVARVLEWKENRFQILEIVE